MSETLGYAAHDAQSPLAPYRFQRRAPGTHDVQIDILFCGVCHSDLHTARNEWHNTLYPSVPGHEIIGRVSAVGSAVTRFTVGDIAGVGCLVGSCRSCASCNDGLEQYCETGFTGTYNGSAYGGSENTYGGYSERIVVDEHFVLRISHTDNLAAVAPLLCAGITTYSPLRQWRVQPGQKVGVIGLGGLGHMAVKIAHAMGAHVVMFTTSAGKKDDARRLGAREVVLSKHPEEMAAHQNSFDFILDTVAAPHDLDAYLALLKRDATLTLVGAPAASRAQRLQPDLQTPPTSRLADRRHRRNPGNARLLRRAPDRLGHRADRHARHQPGLRADAQERREVSLRDRHGHAQGLNAVAPMAAVEPLCRGAGCVPGLFSLPHGLFEAFRGLG